MQIADTPLMNLLNLLAWSRHTLQPTGMTTSMPDRGPNVPFPPPLPFVIALGLTAVLDRVAPLPQLIPENWISGSIGFTLVTIGVCTVIAGMLQFRRFKTAVYPTQPASLVVDTGVYARTRNPMYLGLTIAYLGGVLLMASLWALALSYVVLAIIKKQVIRREEAHLMQRFPVEYSAYCAKVPRWI